MSGKSTYTPEMGEKICELIGTTEHGLKTVLEMIAKEIGDAPSLRTVHDWKRVNPEFAAQLKEARRDQAMLLHDEAQKVAREPLPGDITKTVIKPNGTEIHTATSDNVERSKLLVQTLLKRAGQLAPNEYGDKVQAEISGELAIKRVVSDL